MSRIGKKVQGAELLIKRPYMTEKITQLSNNSEKPVYVFRISARANKIAVKKAVAALYKVTPRRVNIINAPEKIIFLRSKQGRRPGYKKAIVYLKKGDKIEEK